MPQNVKFTGTLQVPGDKSISHRALMFCLLAEGECQVERLSPAEDCQSTIRCLTELGVRVEPIPSQAVIFKLKRPAGGILHSPASPLDAGNSGTTIRLLSGLLAGTDVTFTIDGDASLKSRPMARVLNPLIEMGANVSYIEKQGHAPFTVSGTRLKGRHFKLPVASAQVQTALLLAGLHAEGTTTVELPASVRDHTERMFTHIGVPFTSEGPLKTSVSRLAKPVPAYTVTVAGDISSAAFFLVAAACAKGSDVRLTEVGMNSGRTLVIDILSEMGADIKVENEKILSGEPVADLHIRGGSTLKPTTIAGDRIALGIDEIPILALAGTFCNGTFSVRNAQELRVKESDRLSAIVQNFRLAGADIDEHDDGFDIRGKNALSGGSIWKTHGDHRLAMTGMVASVLASKPLKIDDTACAAVSYPAFASDLARITSV